MRVLWWQLGYFFIIFISTFIPPFRPTGNLLAEVVWPLRYTALLVIWSNVIGNVMYRVKNRDTCNRCCCRQHIVGAHTRHQYVISPHPQHPVTSFAAPCIAVDQTETPPHAAGARDKLRPPLRGTVVFASAVSEDGCEWSRRRNPIRRRRS